MHIQQIRQCFPVTRSMAFLNNAAESALCTPVRRRLDEYLDAAATTPDKRPPARHPVRPLLAGLFGGAPEEYALVTSTGVGVGLAAAGYDWSPGDNVVLPAEEHSNNTYPWLALRERGVDVRIVPVGADERLNPDAVAERVDDRTRMVALAAVRHLTGFRADLRAMSGIAHARGALFVVDGVQAAGVVPLDVDDDGIDVLACAGFKWLLGLHGTGFLYVRKTAWERLRPLLPGMFAAEDDLSDVRWLRSAQRYETGSLAYSLFHAWTAGLEMIADIGVPAIHARTLALTSRLMDGLRALGLTVVTPASRPDERSGIVSFTVGTPDENRAVHARLAERHVAIAVRGGRCRVSPAFYNDETDIDRLLEALGES